MLNHDAHAPRAWRRMLGDAGVIVLCLLGGVYAAARAAEPVEAEGWEGAKQALQQVQAPAVEETALPAPERICYRAVEVRTVEGTTAALGLFLGGSVGPEWPIEGAIGLTVADALGALGSASILAGIDAESVPACDGIEKVTLPAPQMENTP